MGKARKVNSVLGESEGYLVGQIQKVRENLQGTGGGENKEATCGLRNRTVLHRPQKGGRLREGSREGAGC